MTTNSERIIITAEHETEDFFVVPFLLEALQRFHTLGRADQRSLVVAAGNCSFFNGGGYFPVEVEDLAKNLQDTGVCKQLLVYNFTVNHLLEVSKGRINGTVNTCSAQKDFWDMVENSLPTVDIQPVVEWVSRAVLEQSDDREEIAKVLNEFRSDPRPGSVGSRKEWTVDNLGDLDVTQLSGLCRYVLTLKNLPRAFNPDQLVGRRRPVMCMGFCPLLLNESQV